MVFNNLALNDLEMINFYINNSEFLRYMITIFGMLFNTFTAVFIRWKKVFWRNNNMMGYFYTIHMTLCSVTLFLHFLYVFIGINFMDSNLDDNLMATQIQVYFFTICNLFQLVITCERFCFFFNFNIFKTIFKIEQRFLIFVLVLIVPLPLIIVVFVLDYDYESFELCTTNSTKFEVNFYVFNSSFEEIIFTFIIFIFQFIPFILLSILSFFIFLKIFKYRNRIDSIVSLGREFNSSVILLAMNFIFFLCNLPSFIVFVFERFVIKGRTLQSNYYNIISTLLQLSFYSLFFFINLFFNNYFKVELNKTFCLVIINNYNDY
jgi:hypothetical protein